MDRNEIQLTAYCGLYCGDCIRYKAKLSDLAREMCEELKRAHFAEYATAKSAFFSEFKHYRESVLLLKRIGDLKCDTPCSLGGDGCAEPCEIKKCVHSKRIEGCWECAEFEQCDRFEFLKPFHGDGPKKNLRKIREHGLEGWALHREKCYPWL